MGKEVCVWITQSQNRTYYVLVIQFSMYNTRCSNSFVQNHSTFCMLVWWHAMEFAQYFTIFFFSFVVLYCLILNVKKWKISMMCFTCNHELYVFKLKFNFTGVIVCLRLWAWVSFCLAGCCLSSIVPWLRDRLSRVGSLQTRWVGGCGSVCVCVGGKVSKRIFKDSECEMYMMTG